ncbi:MAG: hypothetical protein ACW9W3_01915 [Candidatus Nitrosopumilus sp. bin_68KS]
MAFDDTFVTNLILVVVPTVIGVLGSNFLINAWQIRKEKFSLRKDLISSFHESFSKSNIGLYELYVKISEEYTTLPRDSKMDHASHLAIVNFPQNENEKPVKLFLDDYKKLMFKNIELQHKCHHFDTLIDLHFKSPEKFQKPLNSLFDSFEFTINELKRMVYSDNLEDIQTSSLELRNHFEKNYALLSSVTDLLLSEKLKNPQESVFNFSFFKK